MRSCDHCGDATHRFAQARPIAQISHRDLDCLAEMVRAAGLAG